MNDLFSPIETVFADRLLASYSENADASFFVQSLMLAAKNGHLCLYIDDQTILPSMQALFSEDSKELEEQLRSSVKALPEFLLQECECDTFVKKPICKRGNYYYLQRYYIAETTVLNEWKRLCQETSSFQSNSISEEGLLEEQLAAVKLACEKNFVILAGGPGTGKTFTAARMVKAVLENLPEHLKSCYRVALAAPTGKAAAHLEATIKKFLEDFSIEIVGQTLHSLLGIGSNQSVEFLPYDFILVDESSMIDIELMAKLLSAVQSGSKLILIGDENQLPPVEAGSIFTDLKAIHPYTITLKKCVRAELKELAEFGQCINVGDSQAALNIIHQGHIKRIDPKEIDFTEFLEQVAKRFLQDESANFCLLTPLREGCFGSNAINRFIANTIKKRSKSLFRAPIMIAKNDRKNELYNGELGTLFKHNLQSDNFSSQDFALFSNERRFFALLLPRFEFAYCLSVHKSQGSEFDEVVLILPEGTETFGRKVIYTAVTRAKKKMSIYGSEETLCKTLESNVERLSGFHSRLACLDFVNLK